ncbi:MAG TPA: hypothetical protein VN725_06230 [Rhodanobacteraceae bacterium]|nr:hypothetical protein [Rhodanobacteraceae bacterium]
MADIALQLDDALADRLRAVARTRGCTIPELVAQLLHELLPPANTVQAPDAIGAVATHWNQEETAFLHEAALALDEVPAGNPLRAPDQSEWDKPGR